MALLENAGKVLKVGKIAIYIFKRIFSKKQKDKETTRLQKRISEYEEEISRLQQEVTNLEKLNQTLADRLSDMEKKLKIIQTWAILSTIIAMVLLILLFINR